MHPKGLEKLKRVWAKRFSVLCFLRGSVEVRTNLTGLHDLRGAAFEPGL